MKAISTQIDPKKFFFRISIFSAESVRGSNQHYQKVRLDPNEIPNCWYAHRNDMAENIPRYPNNRDMVVTYQMTMIKNDYF